METCWLRIVLFVCFSILRITCNSYNLLSTVQLYGGCFEYAINITDKDLMTPDIDLCKNTDIVQCFATHEDNILKFIDGHPVDRRKNVMRSLNTGFNFVCHNNGQPLKDFVADKRNSECIKNTSEDENLRVVNEKWYSMDFYGDDCRTRGHWINAVLLSLNKCRAKFSKEFFLGLVRTMLSDTTCSSIIVREFPHLSASSAVAPILLLNILITIVFMYV